MLSTWKARMPWTMMNRTTQRLIGLGTLALALLLSDGQGFAQLAVQALDGRPAPNQTLGSPLQYWLETNATPRPLRLHVLAANLRNAAVELDLLAVPDPDGQGPAHATLDDPLNLLADTDILAAVNANACAPVGSRERTGTNTVCRRRLPVAILGWAQSTQGLISPPKNPYVAFWVDPTGRGRVGNLLHPVSARMAAAGLSRLLAEGEPTVASSRDLDARTALGLDAEGGQLWLVVAEGGRPGQSEGLTLPELAEFLRGLGCRDAIELDGGPASTMILRRGNQFRMVSRPSGGWARPVPALLTIRERLPGNGQPPARGTRIRP
jgi:hypothetical protein